MLGAIVKLSPAIWRIVSEMGTRLLFIRMDRINVHESQTENLERQLKNGYNFKAEELELKKMTYNLIEERIDKYGIRQIAWEKNYDDTIIRLLSLTSELISKLRIIVNKDVGFEQNETPYRVLKQLENLLQGRAILYNRNNLEESDLNLALQVALSSVDEARGQITKVAINKCPDYLKLNDFVKQTSYMGTKLREELNTLTQIGILIEGKEGNANRWKLDDKWEDLALI